METTTKTMITIKTQVDAPVETVWKCWTTPEDITGWNSASGDWHTPWAKNDLREGGRFTFRMEARDGSQGFEFGGTHDKVVPYKLIESTMGDGRKMRVEFSAVDGKTEVVESFEAENTNPPELQRQGWQSILDNFKKYTEENYL